MNNPMHDVVALSISEPLVGTHYVLTWGRVFDVIDPAELEEVVTMHALSFGILDPRKARVCESLKDASNAKYFYEAFYDISQEKIPLGKSTFPKWRALMRKELKAGKQIWYCGCVASRRSST